MNFINKGPNPAPTQQNKIIREVLKQFKVQPLSKPPETTHNLATIYIFFLIFLLLEMLWKSFEHKVYDNFIYTQALNDIHITHEGADSQKWAA